MSRNVDARNLIWVLWKSRKCLQSSSHCFSPSFSFLLLSFSSHSCLFLCIFSFFFFCRQLTEVNLYCLCMCGFKTTHWSKGNISSAKILKKIDYPCCSSHKLAHQLWMDRNELLPLSIPDFHWLDLMQMFCTQS